MKVKVNVRLREKEDIERITINTPFIKLDSFLKLVSAASTGGEAKIMIQNGEVKVDGEICTMRGKKIYPGAAVVAGGRRFIVAAEGENDG